MKPIYLLPLSLFVLLFFQSCNTLYNTKVIDIEIVEPGKVKISNDYNVVAVKYNNINVSPNPYFSKSFFNKEEIKDDQDYDSIASVLYYELFIEELRKQDFFDTVIELEREDYSKVKVADHGIPDYNAEFDSILRNNIHSEEIGVFLFASEVQKYPIEKVEYTSTKQLHPRLCLYKPNDLQEIADKTQADLLISFDYFSSIDGILHSRETDKASEIVLTQGYWNFYDLKKQEYSFFYNKKDTIIWNTYSSFRQELKKMLPPRKDAIFNAADIAGTNFAHFMIPHWIQVRRMYYHSGHVELKNTDKLVKEGKWLEAAELWKAQNNNPNKNIAAKCKFNMGLVCELQGNIDAALEWVVESFYVFGQENEQHYLNCTEYIRILGQRKRDIKIIETQLEKQEINP